MACRCPRCWVVCWGDGVCFQDERNVAMKDMLMKQDTLIFLLITSIFWGPPALVLLGVIGLFLAAFCDGCAGTQIVPALKGAFGK